MSDDGRSSASLLLVPLTATWSVLAALSSTASPGFGTSPPVDPLSSRFSDGNMFGRDEDEAAPSRLTLSVLLSVSKRLKSARFFDRSVPPMIVSWATCVEGVDLRGHEPYQLRDFWGCESVSIGCNIKHAGYGG